MIRTTPQHLRRIVVAGGISLVGISMLAGAPAAANETLQVGYSIRLLGLSLGSAGMNATISPSSYDLEISAQLSGIASIVSKAHGGARSSGSIEQGRVLSRAYATASSNSKETRTVRMALNAGSVRSVELVPPPEPHPDRVPVTDAHKRGIVDPLSALVMPWRAPISSARRPATGRSPSSTATRVSTSRCPTPARNRSVRPPIPVRSPSARRATRPSPGTETTASKRNTWKTTARSKSG